MSFEAKVKELGLTLPEAPKPVAAYVPAVKVEDYVFSTVPGKFPL